jgi:hypothetical protein
MEYVTELSTQTTKLAGAILTAGYDIDGIIGLEGFLA